MVHSLMVYSPTRGTAFVQALQQACVWLAELVELVEWQWTASWAYAASSASGPGGAAVAAAAEPCAVVLVETVAAVAAELQRKTQGPPLKGLPLAMTTTTLAMMTTTLLKTRMT